MALFSNISSIQIEPLFSRLYTVITGASPNDFAFVEGVTPLSTWPEAVGACLTYLVVIFGGQFIMRGQSPQRLQTLSIVHNAFLTVGSLMLLVWLLDHIVPLVMTEGFFNSICHQSAWSHRYELLFYINYLFKYYELIDTVFLVLKKKKLEFLHYYHHSATLLLCYVQLQGRTPVSWVPIALNLIVHVIMYYYYLLTCFGIRVWWKKHLTTLQITQFVVDLVVICTATYTYYAFNYYPSLPNLGTCAGSEFAAAFGFATLSSYLLLFIQFFISTYNAKPMAKPIKKKDN